MSGSPVDLVGVYYADSDGGGGTNTKACGWENLYIGRVIEGKAAPYRIDRNGGAIGWAPLGSIRFK
jgi:hypothetical protein